jgi:hypothetical protein
MFCRSLKPFHSVEQAGLLRAIKRVARIDGNIGETIE